MKYTFLLPAFKGRFLDEMLRSIQKQTYTDFKVIISDDCSPEDLYSICKPYLSDSRFTYRRNVENMGSKDLVAHWNLLVNMCDTKFLIMASDDDVYEPEFLEKIDKLVQKYPDVDLFRARVKRIEEDNRTLMTDGLFSERVDKIHFTFHIFLANHIPCISNYCFKTRALKEKGGFIDFPKAWFSDDATTLMMANKGCCYTHSILFSFRSSPINISAECKKEDMKQKLDAALSFCRWFKCFFQKLGIIEYEKNPFLYNSIAGLFHAKIERHVTEYIMNCNWKDFCHYIKPCRKELSMSAAVLTYYWLRKKTIRKQ